MLRPVHMVILLAACANSAEPPEPPPSPPPAEEEPPPPPAEPVAEPTAEPTPAALYEECRDRVENPQADAECVKDEDCARAGCSQEVCTTAKVAAEGWNTTCDVQPCFAVLDGCACHEGECTWTVKDALPAGAEPAPAPEPRKELPTRLPTKPAPTEGGG